MLGANAPCYVQAANACLLDASCKPVEDCFATCPAP
jgi:hypothetical protein